jgi:hypothetical protein
MRSVIVKVLLTASAGVGMLAPAAVAGVDPALLALAPPDAKMLIGVQVSQTQASPFGQYLLSQDLFSAAQLDRSTNQILTAAGFDPLRDLREILAASGDGLSGLLLGRGTFQPTKVSKAAVSAGAASSKYRGVELLTLSGTDKNKIAGSIAFLDASTLAAGDTSAVKAVIDRHAAGTVFAGPLADRARQISSANDAWLASVTPPAAFTGGPTGGTRGAAQNSQFGAVQNLLQSAVQLSAGLKFAATQVTLSAEILTRSAQDAQSMADILKFLAGMLQQANAGPNASPNGSKMPSLADAAKIYVSGSVMHLILSVPEQQVEQLLLPGSKQPNSKPPASGQPKKAA